MELDNSEDTPRIEIPLAQLSVEDITQVRCTLDETTVQSYQDLMADGQDFPPIKVFNDGQHNWLADGFHRVEAARRLGQERVWAKIRQGNERDALLYGIHANSKHGLPLSDADKWRAVSFMLNDPECAQWSDGRIAGECGVSQPFVSKVRRNMTQNENESTMRLGKDGRAINVAKIGSKSRETYVRDHAPQIIQTALENDNITLKAAYEIAQALQSCSPRTVAVISAFGVSDPEIIPVLDRIARANRETFQVIEATGYVQSSGDSLPLVRATVRDLQRVLEEAQRFHIYESIEQKWEQETLLKDVVAKTTYWNGQLCLVISNPDIEIAEGSQVRLDRVILYSNN